MGGCGLGGLVVGGVTEVDAAFEELGASTVPKTKRFGWRDLMAYAENWVWPKAYANCRNMADTIGKMTASEQLSLVPVLRRFLHTIAPVVDCPAIVRSLLLLLNVIDILMLSRGNGTSTPEMLEAAVLRHLRAHQDAWGDSIWIPKHHYAMDLAWMWRHLGHLLCCFVHERKHKEPKRVVTNRYSDQRFEKGVLEDVTVQQLFDVETLGLGSVATEQLREAPPSLVAALREIFGPGSLCFSVTEISVLGRRVHKGDVVAYSVDAAHGVAEVRWFARVNGVVYACLSPWHLEAQDQWSAKVVVREEWGLIDASVIRDLLVYSRAATGAVSTVLKPWSMEFV